MRVAQGNFVLDICDRCNWVMEERLLQVRVISPAPSSTVLVNRLGNGGTSDKSMQPGYYQASSSGQSSCDAADAGYYVSENQSSSRLHSSSALFRCAILDNGAV